MCTGVPVPAMARGIVYYVCDDGIRRNPWAEDHPLYAAVQEKIGIMNRMFEILDTQYDKIKDKSRGKGNRKT